MAEWEPEKTSARLRDYMFDSFYQLLSDGKIVNNPADYGRNENDCEDT